MPWAVAWYADRKSLWLPMIDPTISSALNDYNQLDGQIVGLYLTPVTGNRAFIAEIVKGEYKEWAPFIMRQRERQGLPAARPSPRCRSTTSAFSTATATAGRIAKTSIELRRRPRLDCPTPMASKPAAAKPPTDL